MSVGDEHESDVREVAGPSTSIFYVANACGTLLATIREFYDESIIR